MPCDRLVWGIQDVRVQRPLAEPDLMFKTAYDLDQASETADKSSKHLHQQQLSHPVHAVLHPKNLTGQHTAVSCYRCSGKHATKDCQHQIFAKSEGEMNSTPHLAITHFTSRAARVANSQFKFENMAMQMEYMDSNDVISVLPKQPPSNEL